MTQTGSWRTPLVILTCASIILLLSFGTRTSFGIFLAPMSSDLGWGREVFAFAMAIQNLLWGAVQPVAGGFADRYGSGRVIVTCALLYVVGLILMASTSSPGDLVFSGGVLIGIALSGTGFPVILAVVARSVPENQRSLYMGLASAAGSSGQLLMVPVSQVFLTEYGWMTALLTLAVLSALMVPLAASLTGRAISSGADRDQTLGEAIKEARGHGGYWYLTAGFFVCGFHVAFVGTHLPAFIVDSGGEASLGAAALALIGIGNIIGSAGWGYLGGRYPKKYMLSLIYFLRALLFAVLVLTPTTVNGILAFAFAMGLLWLGTVPLTSALVGQIFGPRYMATLFGFVFFSHQVGSFLGVWLGGRVFDATGSYDIMWWCSVALGLASAVLHWPINERPMAQIAPQATS